MKLFPKATGISLAALLFFSFFSCSDSKEWPDADGADPVIRLASVHERTESGRSIVIAGSIHDADGIASVRLVNHDIFLNKTIDIIAIYGKPLTDYDLSFSWPMRESIQGDDFPIEIFVTDVGGRCTKATLRVTLDGDLTPPVFTAAPDKEITVLIKKETVFDLRFTVTDNRAIDHVVVDVEGVEGFPLSFDCGGQRIVEFSRRLIMPSQAAQYRVTITAFDAPAQNGEVRSSVIESLVNVAEMPDFEKMYLADVDSPADLNSDVFGVPMLVEHTGPFSYRARYFNRSAGTRICFIPQKTDFSPICFGPEPGSDILGNDPETVGRISLDRAGVYYLIDFNTKTGVYSVSTYGIDEAIDPVMNLHYGQDDLNTWGDFNNPNNIWWQEWYFGPAESPSKVTRMTQDPTNPHIFFIDAWKLDEGAMHWILHNWHHDNWWNYTSWRVDNPSDPEVFAYYGSLLPDSPHFKGNRSYFDYKYGSTPGFNADKWSDEAYRKTFVPDRWVSASVPRTGSYRLEFDAHLERARLVQAN